ncbi:MAG: aspartate/glutamate racemase family protein [Pseudomonadota bacterium]
MHIGLIGGIGPAATDYYYRGLIAAFAERGHALELTIAHADAPTLLRNLGAQAVDAQVAIYTRLTDRLAAGGAECVVVTSIAGHFCIAPFVAQSRLPVLDMLGELDSAIARSGHRRLGLLGTETVMASRLYGGIASAELVPPEGESLSAVHDAYVTMAASGRVSDAQRRVFDNACESLLQRHGVDAIVLGGTDLALV